MALWATTERPHVDRCATAWLVRRFIDPKARFRFLAPGAPVPRGATPFDLPGARYGHRGSKCTFETSLRLHGLGRDRALRKIARLVHDVDFHAMRLPESPGLDAVLRGLAAARPRDRDVLAGAEVVFDALYARYGGAASR